MIACLNLMINFDDFKEEKNSVVDRESTFSPFEPDFI